MDKLIVTVAVTGGTTMQHHNHNMPYSPKEIAASAIDSWKAGEAVVHLHGRDPLTGGRAHTP